MLLSNYFILRESDLKRNLDKVLLWKSNLSGKFQQFNAIDGSIEVCL